MDVLFIVRPSPSLYDLLLELAYSFNKLYVDEERSFGTPLVDAPRRDITTNSLFYNVRSRSLKDFTEYGVLSGRRPSAASLMNLRSWTTSVMV